MVSLPYKKYVEFIKHIWLYSEFISAGVNFGNVKTKWTEDTHFKGNVKYMNNNTGWWSFFAYLLFELYTNIF